jgi:hypothetical protein
MVQNKENEKKENDIKKIVIARLETLPSNQKISIGSSGEYGKEYSKEELIKHIEKGDAIGEKIEEIQMEFLQSLKEGKFYKYE